VEAGPLVIVKGKTSIKVVLAAAGEGLGIMPVDIGVGGGDLLVEPVHGARYLSPVLDPRPSERTNNPSVVAKP
jgi:hypothetical protein